MVQETQTKKTLRRITEYFCEIAQKEGQKVKTDSERSGRVAE